MQDSTGERDSSEGKYTEASRSISLTPSHSANKQQSLFAPKVTRGEKFMSRRYFWMPAHGADHLEPRFVSPLLDNLNVRLHSRTELKSRIEPRNDTSIQVEWLKDGTPIMASDRILLYFNHGYAALIILGFEESDGGRYTCIAKNVHGSDSIEAQVQLDRAYLIDRIAEKRGREEALQRLIKIKEHMREVERQSEERKVEYKNRVAKEEADRHKAQLESQKLQGRRSVRAASEPVTPVNLLAIHQDLDLTRSSENIEKQVNQAASESYYWRPYRELEDSIILTKEREIYETVVEFETGDELREQYEQEALLRSMNTTAALGGNSHFAFIRVPELKTEEYRCLDQTSSMLPTSIKVDSYLGSLVEDEARAKQNSQFQLSHLATVKSLVAANQELQSQVTKPYGTRLNSGIKDQSDLPKIDTDLARKLPRFVTPVSDNMKVRLRARVELKLRVEPRNDPNLHIEWYKNGKRIQPNLRTQLYFNYGYAALIILGFDKSDNGCYCCCASNDNGTARAEASLQLDDTYMVDEKAERERREVAKRRLIKMKEDMKKAELLAEEKNKSHSIRIAMNEQEEGDSSIKRRRLNGAPNSSEPPGRKKPDLQVTQRQSGKEYALFHKSPVPIQDQYCRRPYRELEDSIILTKEREIYETEIEFETDNDAQSHHLQRPEANQRKLCDQEPRGRISMDEISNEEHSSRRRTTSLSPSPLRYSTPSSISAGLAQRKYIPPIQESIWTTGCESYKRRPYRELEDSIFLTKEREVYETEIEFEPMEVEIGSGIRGIVENMSRKVVQADSLVEISSEPVRALDAEEEEESMSLKLADTEQEAPKRSISVPGVSFVEQTVQPCEHYYWRPYRELEDSIVLKKEKEIYETVIEYETNKEELKNQMDKQAGDSEDELAQKSDHVRELTCVALKEHPHNSVAAVMAKNESVPSSHITLTEPKSSDRYYWKPYRELEDSTFLTREYEVYETETEFEPLKVDSRYESQKPNRVNLNRIRGGDSDLTKNSKFEEMKIRDRVMTEVAGDLRQGPSQVEHSLTQPLRDSANLTNEKEAQHTISRQMNEYVSGVDSKKVLQIQDDECSTLSSLNSKQEEIHPITANPNLDEFQHISTKSPKSTQSHLESIECVELHIPAQLSGNISMSSTVEEKNTEVSVVETQLEMKSRQADDLVDCYKQDEHTFQSSGGTDLEASKQVGAADQTHEENFEFSKGTATSLLERKKIADDEYLDRNHPCNQEDGNVEHLYPRFVIPLEDNFNVRLHARTELKSRIEPKTDGSVKVEWFKDGLPIEPNERVLHYFNHGYAALIILGFKEIDEGRYSCVARNAHGSDRVKANLRLDRSLTSIDRETEKREREKKIERLLKLKETMRIAERLQADRKAEYAARLQRKVESELVERRSLDLLRRDARLAARKARISAEKRFPSEMRPCQFSNEWPSKNLSQPRPSSSDGRDTVRWRSYRESEDSSIPMREIEVHETATDFEPKQATPHDTSSSIDLQTTRQQRSIDREPLGRTSELESFTSTETSMQPDLAKSSESSSAESQKESEEHSSLNSTCRVSDRTFGKVNLISDDKQPYEPLRESERLFASQVEHVQSVQALHPSRIEPDIFEEDCLTYAVNSGTGRDRFIWTTKNSSQTQNSRQNRPESSDCEVAKDLRPVTSHELKAKRIRGGEATSKNELMEGEVDISQPARGIFGMNLLSESPETRPSASNSNEGVNEKSEESDGFEEDSFIYADLKQSESPSLDLGIIDDLAELSKSMDRKVVRRKVVLPQWPLYQPTKLEESEGEWTEYA